MADTGVGIDAAELPRIFDRFYRGSQANEARGSGSGLGLAIVRSIVDMHRGTISVESRLGAGSRFTVSLPPDPRRIAGTPAAQQAAVELDDGGRIALERGRRRPDSRRAAPSRARANMPETSPTDGS